MEKTIGSIAELVVGKEQKNIEIVYVVKNQENMYMLKDGDDKGFDRNLNVLCLRIKNIYKEVSIVELSEKYKQSVKLKKHFKFLV